MLLHLVYCKHCVNHHREFQKMVSQLQGEYPQELAVVPMSCIAACDTSPAVILEYDFYPNITPDELYRRVHDQLDNQHLIEELAREP